MDERASGPDTPGPSSGGVGPGAATPPPEGAIPEPPDEGPPADVDLRKAEEAVEDGAPVEEEHKLGTFGGVFTPTLLTILGVILFLREGWVVGNAGILGATLIIILSFAITACTGLAMSSITTNIRIGAGGAYAIVAQSLGLEIGGALGIPRYLSQALAVTLYIFGFREGWLWIFPEHPAQVVDFTVLLLLFLIAYRSAGFATKIQYVIMAVIAGALVSIAMAAATGSMQYPVEQVGLWGDFRGAPEDGFRGTDFWVVFAVFFPASTGIMAGANMSGDLKTPRRSIPVGTMSAIGVSLVIYLVLAYWLARSATPEELTSNYTVMIDKAYWGPLVLAGLLGATFSSALASLVGSARILMAMGEHRVLPWGRFLEQKTEIGEPRNALWVTAGILVLSILLRDLNAVAPLVTMFFLVTYAMLNGILLVEQSLDLLSFRPKLVVPRWVPLLGLLGSLMAMFVIHPTMAWVSIAIMGGFYWLLLRRRLDAPFSDVRSGLFVSLAEWAATKVSQLPGRQERAWRPNLLVPVETATELQGSFEILTSIARPNGSVRIMGVAADDERADELDRKVAEHAVGFRRRGVFSTATVVRTTGGSFNDGLVSGMQALRGAFFRPNIVFLRLGDGIGPGRLVDDELKRVVRSAERERMGTHLWAPHPMTALGQRSRLNVWVRDRSPDWTIGWDIGNLDLSILTALKLRKNWGAELRLLMVVEREADVEHAQAFMADFVSLARVHDAETIVECGDFARWVAEAPQADVSIFGLSGDPNLGFIESMVARSGSSCLFVRDSGQESALA